MQSTLSTLRLTHPMLCMSVFTYYVKAFRFLDTVDIDLSGIAIATIGECNVFILGESCAMND